MTLLRRGALVVSCQARADNPLHGSAYMAAMARAAIAGGASGIRANGPADIAAIRAALPDVALVGLLKRDDPGFSVSITPDFVAAHAVAGAGADIVAIDATDRPRQGEPLSALIRRIQGELGCAVLADVATGPEGATAAALGADYVASTLSGYTGAAPPPDQPDLSLVAALVACCGGVPVVAEGRFATPAHVKAAFERGAYAVVVGTAITNPREITRRFASAVPAG